MKFEFLWFSAIFQASQIKNSLKLLFRKSIFKNFMFMDPCIIVQFIKKIQQDAMMQVGGRCQAHCA
jgi:hypothetical protein